MGIEDETFVSGICPSGFCCQREHCSFIYHGDELCAANRDADSFLCSLCIDGYSESVSGPECVKCDKNVHWEFMLLPFGMAVGTSLFILLTHTDKDTEEINRQRANSTNHGLPVELTRTSTARSVMLGNVNSEDNKIMLGSLAKITIYYEQVSTQRIVHIFVPWLKMLEC